jgi:hypothetical protein
MEALGDEDDIEVRVERVSDAGERLVPFVRFRGHARTSGAPFDHLWGYVVEVRDQRIAYLRAYYEPGRPSKPSGCGSSRVVEDVPAVSRRLSSFC